MADNRYMSNHNSPQSTIDGLRREILFVRDEYRHALTDEARDSAKRYHDDLMRELRELTD